MTPRRKPPILRENDRDSTGPRYEFSWQQIQTGPAIRRQVTGSIGSLFRRAMKILTGRAEPAPQPTKRRRRSGEAAAAFKLAARAILRPISRLSVVIRSTAFLHETFPWLHLWEWNETSDKYDISEGSDPNDNNHLSPRL